MKTRRWKGAAWLLMVGIVLSVCAIPASAEYTYPMNYSVYYVNEAGTAVAPTATGTYNAVNGSVSIASPTVAGYVLKNETDAVVTSDMMTKYFPASNYVRQGGASYTVVYTDTGTVSVRYRNQYGRGQMAETQTATGRIGSAYSVLSPSIPYYTPDFVVRSGIYDSLEKSHDVCYYPNVFTVTYHDNGGSGGPGSERKYQKDTNYLSSVVPVRYGYAFLGWSPYAWASTAAYEPGGLYHGKENVTLYAVWSEITYTVSYHANGGTGAPAAQTKYYGQALILRSAIPVRSNHEFLGWATDPSATVATYAAGGSYTANADVTLYAVWQRIPETYTVSYHANGGTDAPTAQIKIEDVPLMLASGLPIKSGYRFNGWGRDPGMTSADYVPGEAYTENAGALLYAIWTPELYTVTFHANGGEGAPNRLTKTHDLPTTVPVAEPEREHYRFLGWSLSPSSEKPDFYAGGVYAEEGDRILYAVWEFVNYDFSVSDLTVSSEGIYQYDTVTVKCRLDSWDPESAYENILFELLVDGVPIHTEPVNFAANGVQYVTVSLNVGALVEEHLLEARVNWTDHESETRIGNNAVSIAITVLQVYAVETEAVAPNGAYLVGNEVVTTFLLCNHTATPLLPDDHMNFTFEVYILDEEDREILLERQVREDVVVPANGRNLVYFKWSIPAASAYRTLWCRGSASGEGSGKEESLTDNTAFFNVVPQEAVSSQTPDTRYEATAPAGYRGNTPPPTASSSTATWNLWEYEGGELVLKTYGISISRGEPTVTADTKCPTASTENGVLTMRSGYGIFLSWSPVIVWDAAYSRAPIDAYTSIQNVFARFPEFGYATGTGQYRTLEYSGGAYRFSINPKASGERLHFIPVYVENGPYVVSVSVSQFWTPAGMLTVTRNAPSVMIDGTVYDDWYHG